VFAWGDVVTDVLFVGHTAETSGAPRALLYMADRLAARGSLTFEFLLGLGGPLEDAYRALAPVTRVGDTPDGFLDGFGVVYANSVWSHPIIDRLGPRQSPLLSHVHELAGGLVGLDLLCASGKPAHYIAVSQAVRRLLHGYGIVDGSITVVPAFVPVGVGRNAIGERAPALREAGVPVDACVVGAVGAVWEYKGPDLFIDLAEAVCSRMPAPPTFVWVGGPERHPRLGALRQLVASRGLGDHVFFVGPRLDPLPLMAAFDVYALTSREDPFPLAMLEAAALRRPVVAFDVAGGAEFLASTPGCLVPPFAVEEMADVVVRLLGDRDEATRLGEQLRHRVRSGYDAPSAARRIETLIRSYL
jgi:glycosyltransferase involved in cell wall biosynthesis